MLKYSTTCLRLNWGSLFLAEAVIQHALKYSVIQKDELNFVRLYFLNYTWCVNDLHNI